MVLNINMVTWAGEILSLAGVALPARHRIYVHDH